MSILFVAIKTLTRKVLFNYLIVYVIIVWNKIQQNQNKIFY